MIMYQIFILIVLFGNVISLGPFRPFNTDPCPDANGGASFFNGTAGACYDTPGCAMPYCCGVVTGEPVQLALPYNATKSVDKGTVEIIYTGVNLTIPIPPLPIPLLSLPLPVPIELPPWLLNILTVNNSMCYHPNDINGNICPQEAGNVYTYTLFATFPRLVTYTATLAFRIKVMATSDLGETIFCGMLNARFFSPDLKWILGPFA